MKLKTFFTVDQSPTGNRLKKFLNYLLVIVFLVVFFMISLSRVGIRLDFSFLGEMKFRIWKGFGMTVGLSLLSLIFSLFLGTLTAIGHRSNILFFRYLSDIYIKCIRGTPLIMQIYLFFYIIGTAWGIHNRFIAGVLILSIFEGAYIAEIIRGSLNSISVRQLEAATAVGFTKKQTLVHVILPQMITSALPALTGQFASIIKDSSLLSIIALIELMQTMREISATNFMLFECYLFLGVLYLCLTLPISFLSKSIERRFNDETTI